MLTKHILLYLDCLICDGDRDNLEQSYGLTFSLITKTENNV